MTNVVRKDVVQLGFEIDGFKELKKLQDELDDLKKKLTGGIGEDALDDLKNKSNESVKPLKKVKEEAEKVTKSVTDIGKKGATIAFSGLKKLAGISFKGLAVGIGAAATAIGGLVAKSVTAYAEFEQLEGGVQTLFKNSAGTVQKYANDAFKTAGLSANEYMDTVTSFSASLINSVGGDTKKAADLANTAIIDMSDNANKMGTDMDTIIQTYQSLSRGNFAMLDNLKLGYGGTKEELKRLISDAAKLDKSVKANDMSYANIVKAIHAVQEEMGIMGTTQKEAEKTITGSLNMMKSAWGNLMPALIQGGDAFDQCLDNLIYSVDKFSDNIMPAVEKALGGVGVLIEKLVPKFAEKFPEYAELLLPPLIKASIDLTKGLIKALPSIVRTVAVTIVDIFGEQFPIIGKIAGFFEDNAATIANSIKKIIPVVLGLVAAFKLLQGVKAISSIFGSLGGGKGGGGKGGIFGLFASLAKMKTTTVLKGMGNLAIILGGFAILTAAFMAVAPHMADLTDLKSVLKVVVVIGALGLLGTALVKLSQIVGVVPVATVALGLANMAIMLAGLTVLTAAFMFVAPYIAKLSDGKSVLKVVGVMALLGTLGTTMALFAAVAGIIPVPLVLLGLANMAIMIAGLTALTALFMLVAPKVATLSDSGSVFKVMGIMGVLGALGTTLTVFAGIAGLVPVPVVLAGLANMALVLGGITGIITAFGALSSISGFTEFIESGGALLTKIFGIIGEMAGSLIGGFGEGVTASLPVMGENISGFVTALKPMFTMIQGTDLSNVGPFFNALVNFMLKMSANDILSFFTGGTEWAQLGTDLSSFATNSSGFFTTVAALPVNGFTNAKLLFQSLGDIGNVPNTGGVAQWFSGTNDYEDLANGLQQLSSAKVIYFYNAMALLPKLGFDNAILLFNSIADISNIPNTGGVAQWFSGTNDYADLAAGLQQLSSEGVINFYKTVATLPVKSFDNTKLLFQSIADIGNIPNTGGVAQFFSGENDFSGVATKLPPFGRSMAAFYKSIEVIDDPSKISALFEALKSISKVPNEGGVFQAIGEFFGGENGLGTVGEELKTFGENTKSFFASVNKLNVSKLNQLWDSLKKPKELTTNLSNVVGDAIDGIVDKVSQLPSKMGEAIRKAGGSLSSALVDIWKSAVTASSKPMNKLISGANWILTQFGSEKKVSAWTPYAKGTSGHKGGNALVNDGNGAELVQMPNGYSFIPRGKNVLIPNAPEGMKVMPAGQTAELMGRNSPTYRYAKGTGDIDIWSYMDNAAGLISAVKSKFVDYKGTKNSIRHISKGMVDTVSGQMTNWADKLFDEFGALSLEAYDPSKGVAQWKSTVIRALKMENQYSEANLKKTLYQMQTESGGNPKAINLWDSNAKKGIPSKGLMQVIDPTFKAYARAGFNKNIYDPLSNILASIRYAVSRYGTLSKAYRGVGYANGGFANKPSIFGEDGLEAAIPLSKDKRKRGINLWAKTGEMLGITPRTPDGSGSTHQETNIENNTYSPVFNLTINGDSDRALERKVRQWIQESMNEVFESVSRRNPRLREV